jgi:Flp pilus assembly protein TadG
MNYWPSDHSGALSQATRFGSRRAKRRPAAAAAEFALILPFLGMLVFGMIEFSRAMMVGETLSNAARKGCNTGIKPNKTDADIKNDVNNILTDNNIDPTAATITILVRDQPYNPANPPRQFDKVSVQVSIPVSAVYWGGTILLSGQAVQSETVVMMRQG